jgi:DNA-directed RNA polymerase subunit RPC12/RpoP
MTQRNGGSFSPPEIPATDILNPLSERRGSLFVYLSAVLSRLAQDLSRYSEEDRHCALCPDVILPTQLARQDRGGAWVHAMCLEMKLRKEAILEAVNTQAHACPLCGHRVLPWGVHFHEGGLTMSYACPEPAHGEPHFFSFPLTTSEARRIGMWEARLRERLKEKGYVRCCECGRQISVAQAQSLGAGWYYCGCLPELWKSGP